ncbi:hypothetical protein NMG60_11025494 [Bertholletia excelsa]
MPSVINRGSLVFLKSFCVVTLLGSVSLKLTEATRPLHGGRQPEKQIPVIPSERKGPAPQHGGNPCTFNPSPPGADNCHVKRSPSPPKATNVAAAVVPPAN